MYINEISVTAVPVFFEKSTDGDFYYLGSTLAFFPYPKGRNEIPFELDEDGEPYEIVAHGSLHSQEDIAEITCQGCGETFEKQINTTYLYITDYAPATKRVVLDDTDYVENGGVVAGDVQKVAIITGKDFKNKKVPKEFYTARIAIKDRTAQIGFSYVTVSSLHPFTVMKGDRLMSKGRIVTKQYCLNAVCPHCFYQNMVVNDSTTFQAKSVQSLNQWNYNKED